MLIVVDDMKKFMRSSAAFMIALGILSAGISADVTDKNISVINVSAAEKTADIVHSGEFENIKWTIDKSGLLTISGSGLMKNTADTTFDKYLRGDLYSVPAGLGWLEYNDEIISASVGDGIENIGKYAFYGCKNLKRVKISSSVKHFGEDNLRDIHNCFGGCTSLEKADIDGGNTAFGSVDGVIFDKDMTVLMMYPAGAKGSSYSVPDGVEEAAAFCFADNKSIKAVKLPESIERIGISAFADSSLQKINIPEKVTEIPDCAFLGTPLKEIELSENIEIIGKNAFTRCYDLKSIKFPAALKSVKDYAFVSCGLTSADIPGNVSFGREVFGECHDLRSAVLGKGCNLSDEMFRSCDSLEKIILPDDLGTISNGAFYGCKSLPEINIPRTVRKIGGEAFYKCSALNGIKISSYIGSIGDSAFYGCTSLEKFLVGKNNKKFRAYGGALYSKDMKTLVSVPAGKSGVIKIHGGTETISDSAFGGCEKLKRIILPESIEKIGGAAFCECTALRNVNIPENVSEMGYFCFADCKSLVSADLPGSLGKIPMYAFYGCTSLSDVTINEGITAIENNAFENCTSLKRIAFPAGISEIGEEAFKNCTSLEDVKFRSRISDINIRDTAFGGCESLGDTVLEDYKFIIEDDLSDD